MGGYAISAYGPTRFSVDVDLVFPSDQEAPASQWLDEAKVPYSRTYGRSRAFPALSKLRLARASLSGDFYFGGLRARETGSVVDYDWIAKASRRVEIQLTTGRLRRPIAVARPEALWVLKLLAGRSQDRSDLFSIATEPVSIPEIREKISEFDSPVERAHLRSVRDEVLRGDDYADALSRRELGSPKLPRNQKMWRQFQDRVVDVLRPID